MFSKELTKDKLLSSKFQYATHDVQVEKARNNPVEIQKKNIKKQINKQTKRNHPLFHKTTCTILPASRDLIEDYLRFLEYFSLYFVNLG